MQKELEKILKGYIVYSYKKTRHYLVASEDKMRKIVAQLDELGYEVPEGFYYPNRYEEVLVISEDNNIIYFDEITVEMLRNDKEIYLNRKLLTVEIIRSNGDYRTVNGSRLESDIYYLNLKKGTQKMTHENCGMVAKKVFLGETVYICDRLYKLKEEN